MRGISKLKPRVIPPDSKYQNFLVSQLINKIMLKGKKKTAQNLVYKAFDQIKTKLDKDPVEVFTKAVANTSPLVEVRSRRIGGATYQVPYEVSPARQHALALRWIVDEARSKKGKSLDKFLAEVITEAYNNTGMVVKKKDELHKLAEANRAFVHYARF